MPTVTLLPKYNDIIGTHVTPYFGIYVLCVVIYWHIYVICTVIG